MALLHRAEDLHRGFEGGCCTCGFRRVSALPVEGEFSGIPPARRDFSLSRAVVFSRSRHPVDRGSARLERRRRDEQRPGDGMSGSRATSSRRGRRDVVETSRASARAREGAADEPSGPSAQRRRARARARGREGVGGGGRAGGGAVSQWGGNGTPPDHNARRGSRAPQRHPPLKLILAAPKAWQDKGAGASEHLFRRFPREKKAPRMIRGGADEMMRGLPVRWEPHPSSTFRPRPGAPDHTPW